MPAEGFLLHLVSVAGILPINMYVGGLLQLLEHGVLVEVAHVSAFTYAKERVTFR